MVGVVEPLPCTSEPSASLLPMGKEDGAGGALRFYAAVYGKETPANFQTELASAMRPAPVGTSLVEERMYGKRVFAENVEVTGRE